MAASTPYDHQAGGINIEAWTQQATVALADISISVANQSTRLTPRLPRGTAVTLDIPLDDEPIAPIDPTARPRTPRQREPLRRDSLKRREALLKGKEGSRRRQKWENDRLLGNPWLEPPTADDWTPRPTHHVAEVPYFLAPLWDQRQAARRDEDAARDATPQDAHRVPRDLREKLKRAKGAKTLLQDLEERVREFVQMWEDKERELERDGLADVDSSEEEEIVFVGRNGVMRERDAAVREGNKQLQKDQLVFDSLVDDHGASFGYVFLLFFFATILTFVSSRWLVHSIGTYYDLRTWSITTGDPARREAYVGIKASDTKKHCLTAVESPLPRPLWCLV